ncbi:hypothetical protein D6V40_18625, partial [Vibrio cholerae]|nr:hypothetical protein [Vibrio cholerae]
LAVLMVAMISYQRLNRIFPKAIKKERFVIKKVGTIPLGDRYDGTVTYRLGFLTISACKGLKALRTKHERVFIL